MLSSTAVCAHQSQCTECSILIYELAMAHRGVGYGRAVEGVGARVGAQGQRGRHGQALHPVGEGAPHLDHAAQAAAVGARHQQRGSGEPQVKIAGRSPGIQYA